MDPVLLLAEGDPTFTLSLTVIVGLITTAVTVGVTVGIMKYKGKVTEEKQTEDRQDARDTRAELKAKDDKIEAALAKLGEQMGDTKDVLKSKMMDLNREQKEKQDRFESKVFGRFDRVDKQLAEHEKRLSVAEQDREHIKKEQERHARKLTRLPSSD